jgi:hypothetical protein
VSDDNRIGPVVGESFDDASVKPLPDRGVHVLGADRGHLLGDEVSVDPEIGRKGQEGVDPYFSRRIPPCNGRIRPAGNRAARGEHKNTRPTDHSTALASE